MAPDFNIATGEEQPINRTGVDNVQLSGKNQGVPMAIDNSGAEPALVAADADSAVALHTVGVLFPREVLPADLSNVTDHPWADVEKQIYLEERTLTGDRVTVIRYGIEMVDDSGEVTFTPGEPVYLAPGGGFTQTKPSAVGDVVQVVGVAMTNDGDDRARFLLDVEAGYEVVA